MRKDPSYTVTILSLSFFFAKEQLSFASLLTHWLLWFPESLLRKENLRTRVVSTEEVGNISKWSKAGSWLPHAETEHWYIIFLTHKISRKMGVSAWLQCVTCKALTSQCHIASFLSLSRTPKVNIVLPLSLVWQDKADKRWSHVSTSHDRRNRGRVHRAVEAERESNTEMND